MAITGTRASAGDLYQKSVPGPFVRFRQGAAPVATFEKDVTDGLVPTMEDGLPSILLQDMTEKPRIRREQWLLDQNGQRIIVRETAPEAPPNSIGDAPLQSGILPLVLPERPDLNEDESLYYRMTGILPLNLSPEAIRLALEDMNIKKTKPPLNLTPASELANPRRSQFLLTPDGTRKYIVG